MAVIDAVAKEFKMKPEDLIRESLKTFLEKKLTMIEADIFLLARKYGVRDVFELDSKVREGIVSEEESYEDYFTFDNLEAEREKIQQLLENL